MPRFTRLLCLPLLACAVGCSNRPLVGLMDCIFPARASTRPPDDLPRPTDRDPLPPPAFDPAPSGGGFRRDDSPRIGDPVAPDGRRPTTDEVPFTRESAPGPIPLPGGRN